MRVLGAVIAGGKSSRMGQDKALIIWQGKPLIQHVVERLSPQVDGLVVNANGARADLAFLGLPVIADMISVGTPLAGLQAILVYAFEHGFDAVLSAPCDCPLLPLDLRRRLEGKGAAIASSGGQDHYLTGFWPTSLGRLLVGPALRRVKDFAAAAHARPVQWDSAGDDPFLNVNTPEEFQRLSEKP